MPGALGILQKEGDRNWFSVCEGEGLGDLKVGTGAWTPRTGARRERTPCARCGGLEDWGVEFPKGRQWLPVTPILPESPEPENSGAALSMEDLRGMASLGL